MDRADAWHSKEKKNSRKGLVTSLVIHSLLLLLFILLTASLKQPDDQIQGVLIDFGSSQTGQGSTAQPSAQQQQEVTETQQVESAPASAQQSTPDVADEVITQDYEVAPAINTQDETNAEQLAAEQAAAEQAAAEQAAAEAAAAEAAAQAAAQAAAEQAAQDFKNELDQAWNSGGGDGNTEPGGDQGVQDGVPNGPYNEGNSSTGLGDSGIGHDLSGRKMLTRPTISDVSQKTGKVAVKVKVDRNGKVISAEYTTKGSTTTDAYLIQLAVQAAKQAKFNSDFNAASEQIGTIYFTFRVQ